MVARIRGYVLPLGGRPQGSPLPCRRTSAQPCRRHPHNRAGGHPHNYTGGHPHNRAGGHPHNRAGDRTWCVVGVFVIIVLFLVIDKSVQCSCLFTICFITGVRVYYVRARGFSLAAAYVRTSAAMIPRVGATLAVARMRGYVLPFGGRTQGSPLPCRRTSAQP